MVHLPPGYDTIIRLYPKLVHRLSRAGRNSRWGRPYSRLGRCRSCRQVKKAIASVKSTAMPA